MTTTTSTYDCRKALISLIRTTRNMDAVQDNAPNEIMDAELAVNHSLQVGDKVRSFDFADGEYGRELSGGRAAYAEGFIVEIGPMPDAPANDCPRYHIRVTRDVFGGKGRIGENSRVGTMVYPPVNGTPTTMGNTTYGVEYAW